MTSGATTAGSTLPTEAKVCCKNIATRAVSIRDNVRRLLGGLSQSQCFRLFVASKPVTPPDNCNLPAPSRLAQTGVIFEEANLSRRRYAHEAGQLRSTRASGLDARKYTLTHLE